jgi:two-component system chemotaxis response regulator CheB
MSKIRVLIVDDAVVMRRLISEVIAGDPGLEVAGVAANGSIALQKISQVNPDVITLDVEMPEMDGVATVREIRKQYPRLPVIMFSTLTQRGAETTLDALTAGATDYVTKPANVGSISESISRLERELIPRIKAHCRHVIPFETPLVVRRLERPATPVTVPPRPPGPQQVGLLCVGSSTGGPNALADLFSGLAKPLPVPVLIVQHMPPVFTRILAERLGKVSGLPCHEAEAGQLIESGHVYLAPGGRHLELAREANKLVARLHDGPPENSCRPAVDVLFRSAATLMGPSVLAVVLTGMGQDGLRGSEVIRERGGRILAQDEASSVVWGMPGHVANAGLAEAVLPLTELSGEISRRLRARAG